MTTTTPLLPGIRFGDLRSALSQARLTGDWRQVARMMDEVPEIAADERCCQYAHDQLAQVPLHQRPFRLVLGHNTLAVERLASLWTLDLPSVFARRAATTDFILGPPWGYTRQALGAAMTAAKLPAPPSWRLVLSREGHYSSAPHRSKVGPGPFAQVRQPRYQDAITLARIAALGSLAREAERAKDWTRAQLLFAAHDYAHQVKPKVLRLQEILHHARLGASSEIAQAWAALPQDALALMIRHVAYPYWLGNAPVMQLLLGPGQLRRWVLYLAGSYPMPCAQPYGLPYSVTARPDEEGQQLLARAVPATMPALPSQLTQLTLL